MKNFLSAYIRTRKSFRELLLSYIDEYDIYTEFIGKELEVGGSNLVESPLRSDSKPTFGLFVHYKEDKIMFNDFALTSGDVFKFIRLFASYHDKIRLRSNLQVVRYIDTKLGLGIFNKANRRRVFNSNVSKVDIRTTRKIKFRSRKLTKFDVMYWEAYNVSKTILNYFNVRSVEYIFDEQNKVVRVFNDDELCYAYVINDKVKLYQPMETNGYKWRNSCPAHYIQGWKQRRHKKKLIITKSMKDIMVFFSILGKHYDIIAPHTEGYNFPQDVVDIINKEYDEVFVIYDFDRAGINGANKLKNLYGWKPKFIDTKRIMVDGKLKVIDKDISDLIINKGLKTAVKRCRKMGL